jgi:hypothetical protein
VRVSAPHITWRGSLRRRRRRMKRRRRRRGHILHIHIHISHPVVIIVSTLISEHFFKSLWGYAHPIFGGGRKLFDHLGVV